MHEDPQFAVALRREALRAEAAHRRLVTLAAPRREPLRVRLADRLPRLRTAPAPCPTC